MILAIILLTALANIALGVISYNKNPKSVTHRLLSLLTVIFALWSIANYFSLNSGTKEETLFWIRVVMLITAPMGPVLYFFIKAFPHYKLSMNKIFFKILISIILFVEFIVFTPLIFSDVTIKNGSITPVPGPGIILYAFLLIGAPLVGSIELIKKYRKSKGYEKLQLKYLIVGVTETFGLQILTNFIAVVVFHYSGFVIFGPVFSLIFVVFITYAIIRHRLLEVRFILVRPLVYLMLIVLAAVIYILGVIFVSHYIFNIKIDQSLLPSHVLIALFIAFTFVPLRNFLEESTNKIFYKGRYDQHDLVYQLTKIIASNITLEDVTTKTLSRLKTTLRISHGAFIIYNSRGFKIFSIGDHPYEDNKRAINKLYNLKRLAIFDEEGSGNIKELMRTIDVSVAVPLFERGKKIGLLLLSEKKSGQIYSNRDVGVLHIFGPAVSVAIQNAKAYEEIKNFNSRLKEEIQHATKNLREANLKLTELGKQKDEFMAIASHELKTPVTSIKLYTQLLHHKFVKAKDLKSAESVTKMDMQINKLVSLINDLLDATKIEEGKLKFNMDVCDLNTILKEIVEEMQLTTKHKIEMQLGKIDRVNADQNRIEQVIINLISNAIKYSPGGNKVIVKTSGEKDKVVLSVQDFGMGLTESEQKRVFERFNRAGQEGPGGLPGLGLGLYISREIIRRHNGKIWVESEKGKGSTFYFSLPLTKSSKK